MISFESVSHRFGDVTVLDEVSLELADPAGGDRRCERDRARAP
jgi:hypothetical protein